MSTGRTSHPKLRPSTPKLHNNAPKREALGQEALGFRASPPLVQSRPQLALGREDDGEVQLVPWTLKNRQGTLLLHHPQRDNYWFDDGDADYRHACIIQKRRTAMANH